MVSAKSNEKCLETFEKRWDEIGVEAESVNEVAAKMDLCVCDGCDHLKGILDLSEASRKCRVPLAA